MDKKSRNTIIISIVALAIVLITVTYAYFSARITGIESASTISLTAGHMGIVYTEGNENVTLTNIYPREEAWATKTFTLTGYNTTAANMKYDLGLNVITNTFTDGYLTYDLTLVSSTNGTPIATKTGLPINGTGTIRFGTGTFTNADGDTHNYELKIYFKDNGLDQNDSQGAVFNANISVTEQGGLTPVNNYVYNGEVTNGTSITSNDGNGLYEYRYNQEGCAGLGGCLVSSYNNHPRLSLLTNATGGWDSSNGWQETSTNSWGVRLKDSESTSPVTEKLYTSINNVPITSMALMFQGSKATSIDLSSFNTSNVTNMEGMFEGSAATTLDLSGFNTSKVTNMSSMFAFSAATTLDLSSFNTSNVTNMSGMFRGSAATTLDLSSFNTSNVTNMSGMFRGSAATTLDLSSFNTSNVTNMSNMFQNSATTTLDLSSFNTSNVTNMSGMFSGSAATLDLSSFNTSNVTNMSNMFQNSDATTLDLSSFDMSNVTNTNYMFRGSDVETIYARTTEDATIFCNIVPNGASVYIGSTKICERQEDV